MSTPSFHVQMTTQRHTPATLTHRSVSDMPINKTSCVLTCSQLHSGKQMVVYGCPKPSALSLAQGRMSCHLSTVLDSPISSHTSLVSLMSHLTPPTLQSGRSHCLSGCLSQKRSSVPGAEIDHFGLCAAACTHSAWVQWCPGYLGDRTASPCPAVRDRLFARKKVLFVLSLQWTDFGDFTADIS